MYDELNFLRPMHPISGTSGQVDHFFEHTKLISHFCFISAAYRHHEIHYVIHLSLTFIHLGERIHIALNLRCYPSQTFLIVMCTCALVYLLSGLSRLFGPRCRKISASE
jgi:hypothetical protein